MNDQTRIELEAAAFRSLVKHLGERTDVQNIDLEIDHLLIDQQPVTLINLTKTVN